MRTVLSCLVLCLGLAVAPSAKAQSFDVWGILAFDDICRVSFESDPVADGIYAIVRHDAGCLGDLDRLTGWSSLNDSASIVLYAGPDFEMIGRLDRERDGFYLGGLMDGSAMEMSFFGTETASAAGQQVGDVFIPTEPLALVAYGQSCQIALSQTPFSETLNVVDWVEGPCPGVLDRVSAWGTTSAGDIWLYDGAGAELVTLAPEGAIYWFGTLPDDGTKVELYLP